jgi:uridine kinase
MAARTAAVRAETRLQEWQQRRGDRPLFIGIGGGSASGKTTLAREMARRLAPLAVEVIGQDRFFKPRDELPTYPSPTRPVPWPDYNHPDSFRLGEMLAHCRAVRGAGVAILEGILVLHYPELRALIDLSCYVAADADERIVRRLRRNLAAGMPLDDIADYYLESVRFQHARYNAPTRHHADLVIPGGLARTREREAIVEALCQTIRRAVSRPGADTADRSPSPDRPARPAPDSGTS